MLKPETKKLIDDLRQILVGKIPVPTKQVEQITLALMFKFMSDIDEENKKLGGKSFFGNEYRNCTWPNIIDRSLSGHERVARYAECLEKMAVNKNIPQFFRDIFRGAYLPFKDTVVLDLFLKSINEFKYEHSENLGDAFEYLLSDVQAQKELGQFRTPRHIIDFIVEIVDPQKEDTILDPACGTAGFLVSAYKHILRANTDPKTNKVGGLLTASERAKLKKQFVGYDISYDFVRLSLANMYLHGFADPKIYEYDTLSDQERWDDNFECILANPPFFSPKGGIRPHNRFSIQATRAEVLFVDYIMEHLTTRGKAGVVVPEGIIFQSGRAYKALRKALVDDGYLYAVVSLPQGAFNPYSGVKTSILLLDKVLAKKSDSILFVKVENDGFDLGARRRPIDKNDLPQSLKIIKKFRESLRKGQALKLKGEEEKYVLIVPKKKIQGNGGHNLTGDRYIEVKTAQKQKWPMVELREVCEILNGYAFKSENYVNDGVRVIRITNVQKGKIVDDNPKFYPTNTKEPIEKYKLLENDLLISLTGNVGRVGLLPKEFLPAGLNQRVACLRVDGKKINKLFLFRILNQDKFEQECIKSASGIAQKNLSTVWLSKIKTPLPPLEVQKQIVAEIGLLQKVVDGAKQMVKNYKPLINFDSSWASVKIEDICDLVRGSSPRPQGDARYYGGNVPRLMISDVTRDGMYTTPQTDFLTEEGAKKSRPMKKGDVIMAVSGNPGLPTILAIDACIHDGFVGFRNLDTEQVLPEFLYYSLLRLKSKHDSKSVGAVFRNLNTDQIKKFEIPTPDIATQQQIVAQIERERGYIDGAGEIARLTEQKIKDKVSEVWK